MLKGKTRRYIIGFACFANITLNNNIKLTSTFNCAQDRFAG
jgi:hypothetical protein